MGTPGFEIDGQMISSSGSVSRVSVRYARDVGEKRYEINGNRPEKLSAAVGQFPLVVLSPENNGVTGGGPGDRRKFLDLVLSQVSATYLESLLEYRRIVKQRNRLLLDFRLLGNTDPERMQPWDESLARLGGAITERRHAFVREFREFVLDAYRIVAGGAETPDIHYVCSGLPAEGGAQEISRMLTEQLVRRRNEEIRRGSTLVGPHRDDIGLLLNGIPVQQYASQGQHKTMLVALKVAEHRYLAERRKEQPILLLDDLFSELDRHRSHRILNLIADLGQVIVTATDEQVFQTSIKWSDCNRRYIVDRGTCTRIREA
jgi:DNA replication and repair protein RecF